MKLPPSIVIGPDKCIIKSIKILDDSLYGMYDSDAKCIFINEKCDRVDTALNLIHEVFHLIYHKYDINDKDEEERIVTRLATGFSEVLSRNKGFRDFIYSSFENGSGNGKAL